MRRRKPSTKPNQPAAAAGEPERVKLLVVARLLRPDAPRYSKRRDVYVLSDDDEPGRETLLFYLDASFAHVDRIKAMFPGAPVVYEPMGNMHPDFAGNRR